MPKGVGVAERRRDSLQPCPGLLASGLRIRRVLDVALVGDGGTTFDVHRAAVGGGPAVAAIQGVAAALVQAAGDAVQLADDKADDGVLLWVWAVTTRAPARTMPSSSWARPRWIASALKRRRLGDDRVNVVRFVRWTPSPTARQACPRR